MPEQYDYVHASINSPIARQTPKAICVMDGKWLAKSQIKSICTDKGDVLREEIYTNIDNFRIVSVEMPLWLVEKHELEVLDD